MSAGFDPVSYFNQQFDLLRQAAGQDSNPALQATIKPKLLNLLSQYRLKLPLAMHQERMVEAGGLLAMLGEHEAALRQCFAPILSTAGSEGLAAVGLNALRLRVQADFGSVASSFELLMQRDAWIERADSTATVRDLLRRVREGLGACVKHEKFYWLVLNGTRLAYRLCTTLMRPERAKDAIETLAWCALCMEGTLPLLAPRFLEWRVQLYTALCHCYEAAGMPEGAAKAVAHALARHDWMKKLDRHDPVPQTESTDALYQRIERKLGALHFKYTTCLGPPPDAEPAAPAGKAPPPKKGEPEPEPEATLKGVTFRGVVLAQTFGEETDSQLVCLLEALSDYSTDPRPLAHATPSEERAALVKELFTSAMELASSPLAALTAHEEAKAALTAAKEAELWESVDMMAPSAKVRVEKALSDVANIYLPDLADHVVPAGGPEAVTGTKPVTFHGRDTSLTFAQDGATLAFAGGDPDGIDAPAPSEEAQMWIDVQVLVASRAIDVAAENERLGAMQHLAAVLSQCWRPQMSSAARARPDILADAALRLWALSVPAISAADAESCAQPKGGSAGGLPTSLQARAPTDSKLRMTLTPRSKSDGIKLANALRQIQFSDPHLSLHVHPKTGVITVSGSGELHLQTVCDKAKLDTKADCITGPILSPTTTLGNMGGGGLDGAFGPGGSPSKAKAGALEQRGGAPGADAAHMDSAQLAAMLMPVYWTLRRVNLVDPLMRGNIALRLVHLLTLEDRPGVAVEVARASVADIEEARSLILTRMAESGLQGAPSSSAASVLQPAGGLQPYTSPSDGVQQALACVHADTLLLLFRAELALGLRKETRKKRDEHAALRRAQLKRREQQEIYGVKSKADILREKEEDESAPVVPTSAPACEQRLLTEFAYDAYAKALLLFEIAPYHAQAEREQLLTQAAELLVAAEGEEKAFATASASVYQMQRGGMGMSSAASVASSNMSGPRPPSVPKPPQLVYRTTSTVCLRARPFLPSGGSSAPKPVATAVYGKEAGVGVAVSLNNIDFAGTGLPRGKNEGADAYDPLADCFVVTGLPPRRPLVFASAAFDDNGNVIGGVGEMTTEVISALPLPRTLMWAYLARQAARLGIVPVAKRATVEVQKALVTTTSAVSLWEQSPTQRVRLVQTHVAYLASSELRAAAQALLLGPTLHTSTAVSESAAMIESLLHCQQLSMGLQLALAIDDAPLAASAVQAVYTSLTPLLRSRRRTIFVLQPLCHCLEALRLLGPTRLTSIKRAPHLLACVGFELATLANEWGLAKLAEHAASLDVASFAAQVEAAQQGAPGASDEPGDAEADKLVGVLYAEYVASQPVLAKHGAPLPEADDSTGVKLWSALATAEDATWAVLGEAADHPRLLEFTVQVCGLILGSQPTEERAIFLTEKLTEALASAAERARYLPLAELLEPEPEAAEAAFAYGGFQPMPRLSQADDKDPPPDITPEMWKPVLRTVEALMDLIGQLRDGGSIGGSDPFAVAIAGKGSAADIAAAAAVASKDGDAVSAISTHVRGPRRWFEVRAHTTDAVSLDFDWCAALVLVVLRQLQMARQWRRQAEIALTFDDLTEGHYGSKLMPYLEQAQQKIAASKWCDGEPLPQVKRRVAELARDQSACVQAIDKCRRAMHALQTKGGGLKDPMGLRAGGGAADAAMATAQELWRDCAVLCRSRRETAMLVESLAALGVLQLADGKVGRAGEAWHAALDSIFTTQDVCKHWMPFFDPKTTPVTQKVAIPELGRALGMLGCLARHTTTHRLERRLQHALFASHLCTSLTSTSIVNPSRLIDWAGFRLTELPSDLFSTFVVEDLEIMGGLHSIAATLLGYLMPLRALPVLAVLKHLATDVARDVSHSVAADALTIDALTQLGQVDHACSLVTSALAAADIPLDALELAHAAPPASEAGEAPPPLAQPAISAPYFTHLPPDAEANTPAVRALIDSQPISYLASLAGEPVVKLLALSRARLLLKISERVPASAVGAVAAEAMGGAGADDAAAAAAPPAKGGKADPKGAPAAPEGGNSVGAAEIFRAVESLLDGVTAEDPPVEPAEPPPDGEEPPPPIIPSPATQAAKFALLCEASLLRSCLAQRRGVLKLAIVPLKEAMKGAFPTLPWAGLESVAEGSITTLLPSLQPGALHWLRIRLALATLCLQQGQLDAAEEQIDTGRTETNQAHDKRILRELLLVHARVRVERGELPEAASEYKLWLEDATAALAVDPVVVATASLQYASTLLSLGAGIGAKGAGAGAAKIVSLLRSAEEALRKEAEACGMLSSEKWPCLVQPTPGAMPTGGGEGEGGGPAGSQPVDAASLHNLYLRPLQLLIEAKLKVAIALQLTSSAPAGLSEKAATDAAGVLLSEAKTLAERTLHPRPSLVAKVHHELGRTLRTQAMRAAGNTKWGDARQLYLAACYLHHASAASASRRAILVQLPGAPVTALEPGIALPVPLEGETSQAAELAATRENTMSDSASEGKSSRDLLWLASALLRVRDMPHADQDGHERKQLLLTNYLRAACKPFAEAIAQPPPPASELTLTVPPGFVCLQWYESSPRLGGTTIEPSLSLVFITATKPEEGVDGPYRIGMLTLPRAGVLATSRLLEQESVLPETDEHKPLHVCASAIKELLLPRGVDPEANMGPPPIDESGEPMETVQMKYLEAIEGVSSTQDTSLPNLCTLFDPHMGGAFTDAALAHWLGMLLGPECQELKPLEPK